MKFAKFPLFVCFCLYRPLISGKKGNTQIWNVSSECPPHGPAVCQVLSAKCFFSGGVLHSTKDYANMTIKFKLNGNAYAKLMSEQWRIQKTKEFWFYISAQFWSHLGALGISERSIHILFKSTY